MTSGYTIRQADVRDIEIVGRLIFKMEKELWPETASSLDRQCFIETAESLFQECPDFWAFVADSDEGDIIGAMTLNECAAIYAGGRFGEIPEIYVSPSMRSTGVGSAFIQTAVAFGRQKGWPFIEVGAPSVPAWQRTLDFYFREGFKEIGPRLELSL